MLRVIDRQDDKVIVKRTVATKHQNFVSYQIHHLKFYAKNIVIGITTSKIGDASTLTKAREMIGKVIIHPSPG